ncbi:MAG: branched-chain amino acid transport system II carrier protein [Parachlamydiales bacterium]|nr:branched-chain amino acid transport system II carrier protein [Parachlamydiales bacterium]
MKKLGILSLGIAVFAMFFGAGNIVFPLILGRDVSNDIIISLIGFVITGVVVPILGFIATIVYEGDYDKFFSTIGKIPGFILITLCMVIMGPLGASRCVIMSYAAVHQYLPFSLTIYTFIIAVVIFLFCFKENKVVTILGRFLGPVKITLLAAILIMLLFSLHRLPSTPTAPLLGFFEGLKEGYFTLDLIGAFFFSHLIYISMKSENGNDKTSVKKIMNKGIKAGLIGGIFLSIIYCGFGIAAAIYGPEMKTIPDAHLFSALSIKLLGNYGGILANVTVALAMLTTSLALTTVFADYLCFEIFRGKFPYYLILICTIFINIILENLDFSGIMKIIAPIAILIYPSFIVLAIANIFGKLKNFPYTKIAVAMTFLATLFFQGWFKTLFIK